MPFTTPIVNHCTSVCERYTSRPSEGPFRRSANVPVPLGLPTNRADQQCIIQCTALLQGYNNGAASRNYIQPTRRMGVPFQTIPARGNGPAEMAVGLYHRSYPALPLVSPSGAAITQVNQSAAF